MANVPVRRESSAPSTELSYVINPLQSMREFFRMDPLAVLSRAWPFDRRTYSVQFDVKETSDSYIFRADVPGVKEQDLDVMLNHNRLVVAGKRETEKEGQTETHYEAERQYGNFSRVFSLPRGVDATHCQADLRNGVLTVQLPKTGESTMKKVTVKAEKSRA